MRKTIDFVSVACRILTIITLAWPHPDIKDEEELVGNRVLENKEETREKESENGTISLSLRLAFFPLCPTPFFRRENTRYSSNSFLIVVVVVTL